MDAEAIAADQTLNHACAEGRADEREEWLPVGDALEAIFLRNPVEEDGSTKVTAEQKLQLSIALERAKRRN